MWKLNPADLRQLEGGGGEPFAHFVDLLIRAEAAIGGLVQAEIETQIRVNKKDGGVDTEVKRAIPHDKTGWLGVPTCWQFKAVTADSIDDKPKKRKKNQLQEEINKWYVAELIKKGYGYRLCLLGDLSPEKLSSWGAKRKGWENQLEKEVKTLNSGAPAPMVIHWADLVAWAERFPALVAKLRHWEQRGFHWDAWRANCRKWTPTYVPNPQWESVRQRILGHAQLDKPCLGGDACLPVGGAAGVGKTRLVFETLAELPEAPALVLYVADEREARSAATAIATATDQTAIVVADECSLETRHFLDENLRGHTNRIRAICLDNTGQRLATATGQVWLTADTLTNTESILAANFPSVPGERRARYARFTKGFVRFAADMCRHDLELAAGDMSRTLESVERYVRHRLGDYLPVISAIALFHKIGYKEDVSDELDILCAFTGHPRQQFVDAVRTVRESPGFVVQAGRYWYVTPEIVTPVLFAEGWQRWISANLEGVLKKLPEHLLHQLLDRVATHGTKEVRDQVGNFFRAWFSELRTHDLTDPAMAALTATLVETSPAEYLPQLRVVIERAHPGDVRIIAGQVLGAKWGPRRTFVWMLERLVSFPEYFGDCEAILFRLAVEESEPQIGNNATAIWSNLFSVHLSGTATPFDRRLPSLEKRISSPIIQEARLGFMGLAKALKLSDGHILGEPVVAGRLRPDDWEPKTLGEERGCFRSALNLCAKYLHSDFNDEHHRLAFKVLADNLLYLLGIGLVDDLRQLINRKNLTEDEARKLLESADDFLEREETRASRRANEPLLAYLRNVQDWSNQFRPTDFAGQLRVVCARAPWDHRFAREPGKERDETNDLAEQIVQEPSLLAVQFDWLASPEAQSAQRLGFALGRIDATEECGRTPGPAA